MFNNNLDISVVVPVFNEQAVLEEFFKQTAAVLGGEGVSYEIVFIDDGSRDRSYDILRGLKQSAGDKVRIIKLARNFGHQLAITAGLRAAQGQAVAVMDSDLQDPPSVLPEFIRQWREGYQVVYGVRSGRKGESLFKLWTAALFYKLIRRITKIDIPENAGDFYLLDRKVVDVLNAMEERHRFIRGLIVWVGFKRKAVSYQREARHAGSTKFGVWKMIKFSVDAMTSFSFAPLKMIVAFGALISLLSFAGIMIIVYHYFFTDRNIVGWTSLMVSILFIGGVQLMAIGLIGEYVARIGDDVKKRPLYTVDEIL